MKSGIVLHQNDTPARRSLSPSQRRFWLLQQLHPGTSVQNFALGLRFHESVATEGLQAALEEVIKQHEVLRTQFHTVAEIAQPAPLSSARVAVEPIDLRKIAPEDRESQLSHLAREEMRKPFDLANGPLLSAKLFRLDETEFVFLLTVPGIVCDRISLRLLLEEVESLYHGRTLEESKQPAKSPLQYRELAEQEAADSEKQLSYWKQQLAGVGGIHLPADHPRPAAQTFRGAAQTRWIDSRLLRRLRDLGQRHDVTLFTTLLAGFNALLFRYSKQDDIVVGTREPGRSRPETKTLIGPLENLLALRTNVSGDPSFSEVLGRVRTVVESALSHADVPFETLVRELSPERDISRHPLFQILFAMQDPSLTESATERNLTFYEVDISAAQFDLSVECVTRQDKLEIKFSYSPDLFDASTIERMMGHFERLLESAAENPSLKISQLALLNESERHQLLAERNQTDTSFLPAECIHQVFERQVQRTPDNVAVVLDDESLTYTELNRRANRLAHYLRKLGVGPDARVGICLERSFNMIVGLLAVLKAGGAYVPLDPAYPRERLQFMLRDSAPAVLLTEIEFRDRFTGISEQVRLVDMGATRAWELEAETDLDCTATAVTPRNLAYVIYTSGSTGTPKGVMVEHANVTRLFTSTDGWFHFSAEDVWSLFHSYAFDFSVWEIWGALFYGGRVVIVPRDVARSPEDFYELLCRSKVTVLNQTPSAFRQLITAQGKSKQVHQLRYIVFGGEALETATLKPWYDQNRGRNTKLINMYGITETTVHVTYRPLTESDTDRRGGSPVGCRIPDLRIYILDEHRQPVPLGVVGELYVGGAGVARGYLNRPQLTAERFLPDPFVENSEARMYKAGDLGRWVGNGEIEFLGRNDLQVKIRGFRIELGEIEARLAQEPGIQEAVVIAREDTAEDKRLVAYYTTASGRDDVSADKLRMHLSACLPDYMVPAAYVRLKSFPLTTNGKLDRKALPAPRPQELSAAVAPENGLESMLASIFASTLGLPFVGITDNFFHLGGHSFLAAFLIARVRELTGQQIPLSALFRAPTVKSLAQLIEQEIPNPGDPVVMEIQSGNRKRLPFFAIVSPGQEALGYAILARHMGPNQTVYKVQGYAPVVRNRPYTEQEMRAIAKDYTAAILAVEPEGPYCLGGMCEGTHIAERITLELEAQKLEVRIFAIFDTWPLQNTQNPWLWRIYYYQQRMQEIRGSNFAKQIEICTRALANTVRRMTGNARPTSEWPRVYWPKDFVPPRFRAPVALFKRPKQPYYYVNDPEMGWGARSAGGVEIHEIPFNHLELFREPHVRTLGQELAQCIERAGQQTSMLLRNTQHTRASSLITAHGGVD